MPTTTRPSFSVRPPTGAAPLSGGTPAVDGNAVPGAAAGAGASPLDAQRSAAARAVTDDLKGADAYVARFDTERRATDVVVGGATLRLGEAQNIRDPSFVAEAGKPLAVVPPPRLFGGGTKSVAFTWRLDDGRTGTTPITDGTRDPRTGALVPLPARVDVPPDAAGRLRIRFEVEDKDGRVRTQWDPSYDAVVLPKGGATVFFGDDFTYGVDGQIRASETLRIAYDADRLQKIIGRVDVDDARACVSFDGAPPIELPLLGEGGVAFLPGVRVPDDALSVEIWFKGSAGGEIGWDSRLGKNFTFDVAIASPDADPSWKTAVLADARNIVGGVPKYRGLTDPAAFQVLGPVDGGYNCIAWSVGLRNQWLWPGDRVEAFDQLYASKGYAPLDGLDLSFQPGVEKVALYGRAAGPSTTVTHAARMDREGYWTSKLGNNHLVRHADAAAVCGPSYGEILKVYARPRDDG